MRARELRGKKGQRVNSEGKGSTVRGDIGKRGRERERGKEGMTQE